MVLDLLSQRSLDFCERQILTDYSELMSGYETLTKIFDFIFGGESKRLLSLAPPL